MAARSLLLLGVLAAIMLVCLEVAYAQELTEESNGSGKNVGDGGALGNRYGQPGYFGGRGGSYQNAYGGSYEPRYGGRYRRGYEPRYGGRYRRGYEPRYGGRYGGYGGRLGSGLGRNGVQLGRGGYNRGVGYRGGRN